MNQLQHLRVVPLSAVTFEQNIGFARPPTPGWILWHGGALGGAPHVENGIDEAPSGFDAVAAIEERSVAAHTVIQERSVSAARGVSKTVAIAEIHGDVANAHFGAGPLGAEGNGNAFVGLDIQDQAIGFNFFFAENDVRSTTKLDHDLRAALGEALAGTKVKRNAGPAPVVDQ